MQPESSKESLGTMLGRFSFLRRERGQRVKLMVKIYPPPAGDERRYIAVDEKGGEVQLLKREQLQVESVVPSIGGPSQEVARGLEEQATIAKRQRRRKTQRG
jgi:hypothetical protein